MFVALIATLLAAAIVMVGVPPAGAGPDGANVRVEIDSGWVSLDNFTGTVTIDFSGDGVDCDQIVVAVADLNEGGITVPCHLMPGWTVDVSDTGGRTASVLLQDVAITSFGDSTATVWVDPDDPDVTVGCDGDVSIGTSGIQRWVQATGTTTLDFTQPGPCAGIDDDSVVPSVTDGMEFGLSATDGDGDMSVDVATVSEPGLYREAAFGTVYGEMWPAGEGVTIEVVPVSEDGGCDGTATSTMQTEVSERGTFMGRMGFNSEGDCVRVTVGPDELQMFPTPAASCALDQTTDQITVDLGNFSEGLPFTTVVAGPLVGNPHEVIITDPDVIYTGPVGDGSGGAYDFVLGSRPAVMQMWHEWTGDAGGARMFTCADAPAPVVDVELNPAETGYWILTETGIAAGVGTSVPVFDDTNSEVLSGPAPAPAAIAAGEMVVSMSITPSGEGYWIFTDAGRVIARGDAVHFGDMVQLAITLDQPAVDSVALPDGTGYYIVAGDGGIFAFGAAAFLGSVPQVLPGVTLDSPVVGLVPNLAGDGYWLVAGDGGIFSFGNVEFKNSLPGILPGVQLAAPIIGALASGDAYLMFANDGGIFNFGTSVFHGSLGANANPDPITSVDVLADRSGYVLIDAEGVVVGFGGAFDFSSGFIHAK